MKTEIDRPADDVLPGPPGPRRPSWVMTRRGWVAGGFLLLLLLGGAVFFLLRTDPPQPIPPEEVRGTPAWAREHYGNADAPRFRARHIVEIDFIGEPMYVHVQAARHFLRLGQIFEELAPEYAAAITSTSDDWSYLNRDVRGGSSKSNHAFGLALDINALANVLGTTGDMPPEVVEQWKTEGGAWGGEFSRPDPMHFETHLTPEEIKARYQRDGTPRDS